MLNDVDTALLRSFLIAMEERSVTKAAARLGMSQPAMSHALSKLRQLFGDPILLRSPTGMVPTQRALDIAEEVKKIVSNFDQVLKPPVPFNPATSQRRFVIAATDHFASLFGPKLIKRLVHEAPSVSLEILAPDRDQHLSGLERGEADLRVGWIPTPHQSLRSKFLFRDRLICISRRDHPAIKGDLTLRTFVELPHIQHQIGGRDPSSTKMIDDILKSQGHTIRAVMLLQENYLVVLSTIASSNTIATLPRRLAQQYVDLLPLAIHPLPFSFPELTFAAYWHERSQTDKGHQWLRSMVSSVAREL